MSSLSHVISGSYHYVEPAAACLTCQVEKPYTVSLFLLLIACCFLFVFCLLLAACFLLAVDHIVENCRCHKLTSLPHVISGSYPYVKPAAAALACQAEKSQTPYTVVFVACCLLLSACFLLAACFSDCCLMLLENCPKLSISKVV